MTPNPSLLSFSSGIGMTTSLCRDMTSSLQEVIESRVSVNHFLPDQSLADNTISTLVHLATKAPSAYNLQNWRFIAVRSNEAKMRLKAAAMGQQKVVDAAVTFIVCGVLQAHRGLGTVLQASVEACIMPQGTVDAWVAQAAAAHEGNTELQRDEAVRSASLAAMTLMLAAEGMGLGSCPMSGFDPAALALEFQLADTEFPVMLVAVGYPVAGNWPQKPRKPIAHVLTIV